MTGELLHLDFETASEVDLTKQGLRRYSRHKSTRVLMAAYSLDEHPVHLWLPHLGPMPEALRRKLLDPSVKIIAHNAAFERAILRDVLSINVPLERFICTQAMAASLALPLGLGDLTRDGLRLRDDRQKDSRGKKLIKLFCEPQKITKKNPHTWATWETHPEEWLEFCDYCRQDVIAERHVFNTLSRYLPDLDDMMHWWQLDQRINNRGVPVDLQLVVGAKEIAERAKEQMRAEMKAISGLDNPNSGDQALPWLIDRGYPYNNLRKERVAMALEYAADKLTDDAKRFLQLRRYASKTSASKLDAILRVVSAESRLHDMFQFRAAGRTGRYGGRVVQLQNLARPAKQVEKHLAHAREMLRERDYDALCTFFDNPLDVVVSCIRSCIAPRKGKKLVVADLSAIELAVLAWLTNCKFWLDVLEKKRDPYKSFGVYFLNKAYEDITKAERNECKPGALGAGYRLGGGFLREDKNGDLVKTGLWGYAESLGVKLTQQQAADAVVVYRDLSPEIVDFWYRLEEAVLECIRDKQPRRVGKLLIDIKAPFLRIRLPSGRRLHYCRPKIEKRKVRGGTNEDGTPRFFDATNMTYEGVDQTTGNWVRMTTHGGKLTENVVQAIALDVLNDGIEEAENEGFPVILHVHDEVGAEVDEDDEVLTLPLLVDCLTRKRKDWCEGLPLAAAGYESTFYKKD